MRHAVVAVVLAIVLALSPEAFARAGKSGSLGSRGSRTYDRPIERSVTPPPTSQPTQPSLAPQTAPTGQPMYRPDAVGQRPMAPQAPLAQPSFFQRHPFVTGMLGGLVGAGIGSMLFGHSPALAAATDAAPFASMMGTILQIALIGGLIWLAVRMFRRRAEPEPVAAPHYEVYQPEPVGRSHLPNTGAPPRIEKEFEAEATDQTAFTDVILGVQAAWSAGDVSKLRALATPEVVGWMSEDLASDASRGVRNVVEGVQLVKGDVVESWRDEVKEYVTARITFSARDYTVRIDDGRVVEGDRDRPVEATELWTFTRTPGGRWLLSAIEQAA
ncbi:MAG: Tim44 domain-containing protein [Solirubrobacterales bacterium]